MFHFKETVKLLPNRFHLRFSHQCVRIAVPLYPYQFLLCYGFNFIHFSRYVVVFYCGFNLHFPNCLKFVSAIYILSLVKCPNLLLLLKNASNFLLNFELSLYTLDMSPLINTWFESIFSYFVTCLSIYFVVFFEDHVFNFSEIQFFNLFFTDHVFGIFSKKTLPSLSTERFSLFFFLTYKEDRFALNSTLGGFSPWLVGSVTLGLWWGSTLWEEVLGGAKLSALLLGCRKELLMFSSRSFIVVSFTFRSMI